MYGDVTFSFDNPDQNRIKECDMSLEEIQLWISECLEEKYRGVQVHISYQIDGYTIICESEVHVKVKKPCDRCGKDLTVTLEGKTELQYIPEKAQQRLPKAKKTKKIETQRIQPKTMQPTTMAFNFKKMNWKLDFTLPQEFHQSKS